MVLVVLVELVFGSVGVGAGVEVAKGVVVFDFVVLVVVFVVVALALVVFVVFVVLVDLAFVVFVVDPVMFTLGIVIYKNLFFPLVCVILVVGVTTEVEFAFEVEFAAAFIKFIEVLSVSLKSSKYIIMTDLRPCVAP